MSAFDLAGVGGCADPTAGSDGALVVDLVPNNGAAPAGTHYRVVFQLEDVVRTEFCLVGTTSPTTIGAVRATPGSGTASQGVSRQYVDSAVAAKASDTSVVHLGGAETIAGTKLFSVSPSVPAPAASTDAVNQAHVDAAVASVGGRDHSCRRTAMPWLGR